MIPGLEWQLKALPGCDSALMTANGSHHDRLGRAILEHGTIGLDPTTRIEDDSHGVGTVYGSHRQARIICGDRTSSHDDSVDERPETVKSLDVGRPGHVV